MSSDNRDKPAVNHVDGGEFEFQLQIGSKLFPEYPVRSHNEAYYQLKKTLGVQASAVHNFDISALTYRDNRFILAADCEKVLDAGVTGINTRAGDLMTVNNSRTEAHHLTVCFPAWRIAFTSSCTPTKF